MWSIIIIPFLGTTLGAASVFLLKVEELIPEMSEGEHSNIGTIAFAMGFILMMALDVGLG